MVAVTYEVARAPASESAARARVATARKSAFHRFFDAILEARLRQAQREIARYAFLLDGRTEALRHPLKLED